MTNMGLRMEPEKLTATQVRERETARAREALARRALAVSEAAWLKAKADLETLLDEIDQT